jgi:hypothetical protein
LGPDALGLIMYTTDGYMSAQLMRRDRPAFDRPESDGGTPEQSAAAAAGYLAYSGPFEVDESTGDPRLRGSIHGRVRDSPRRAQLVFDKVPDVPAGRGRINDTRVAEPAS